MTKQYRLEKDLLGELEVPDDAYWGINTQRALKNFQISGKKFPENFILALAMVKKACLKANEDLHLLENNKVHAMEKALDELLLEKKFLDQFPLDVFQTGSGTQINMNMNEVIANRACEILGFPRGKKTPIHPNDHVNKSQSSNDVIPTTMHLAALDLIYNKFLPSIEELINTLAAKIKQFKDIVKIGRTHLQDAIPIPLAMEFEVYLRQITINKQKIIKASEELLFLPIGGTALGTGLNTEKNFDKMAVEFLKNETGFNFQLNPIKAEGIASHSSIACVSSHLRQLALALMKMANDIRWMSSGPRAGLAELILPANEPGSSIMPGKINPTQIEALLQVCLQVLGNDTTIAYAESYLSNLDLNVAKPLMIVNLLESLTILANSIDSFTERCLKGIEVNYQKIQFYLENTLMIVTKLSPILGYEKAGELAKKAYETGKTIKEVILLEGIDIKDLDKLLDPKTMV